MKFQSKKEVKRYAFLLNANLKLKIVIYVKIHINLAVFNMTLFSFLKK